MDEYLINNHDIYGGVQKIYKFPNNYGASVVRHSFSYGHADGLWEIAVILFDDDGTWDITYDTPITDDVLPNLTDDGVTEALSKIKEL